MDETELDPEELVDQFNAELGEQQEELLQTVIEVEERLDQGLDPENAVEELHQEYRELSKKRIEFMAESDDFTPTKPVKPLRQPKRKDYDGKRGLDALEPDLLEHKQELDKKKDMTLKRAEHTYRRYREEKGLESVEHVLDIPSAINELEGLKEGKKHDIYAVRNYLKDLQKIKQGEKQPEESEYAVPENRELIEDQIDAASQQIYESWETIKSREEEVEEALQQMKKEKEEKPAIDITLRYGIRPVNSSIEGRENHIREIGRNWDLLGDSVKRDLPEGYERRITDKQDISA